jgi:hypothetical protein
MLLHVPKMGTPCPLFEKRGLRRTVSINALLGGWADESLSAHAWRQHLEGKRDWPYQLIDTLLFFDDNHCRESYESEIERNQLPPSMRG